LFAAGAGRVHQAIFQADKRTGRQAHKQTDALADSKNKIIISQMEDSKRAAAKGEMEQEAWPCMVHRQGQQAEDEQQHGR